MLALLEQHLSSLERIYLVHVLFLLLYPPISCHLFREQPFVIHLGSSGISVEPLSIIFFCFILYSFTSPTALWFHCSFFYFSSIPLIFCTPLLISLFCFKVSLVLPSCLSLMSPSTFNQRSIFSPVDFYNCTRPS